jgi:predicted ABC-class ATPase
MIRDDKMMQLVAPDKEPITPFVRKVRSLYEDLGISSILVIGGTGDYFDVADNVIMMDCYKCLDVTERAKQIVASSSQSDRHVSCAPIPFGTIRARYPRGDAYKANGNVKVRSKDDITYGDIEIDLSGLEQVVSKSQTTSISCALQTFARLAADSTSTLPQVLASLEKLMDERGLDILAPGQYNCGFARPRPLEIAGAVNRLRSGDSMRQNLLNAGGAMGGNGNMMQNLQDV